MQVAPSPHGEHWGSDRKSALDLPPRGLQPRPLSAALDRSPWADSHRLPSPQPRRALPSILPAGPSRMQITRPPSPALPPTPASMDLLFRKHLLPSSPLTHAWISG